MDGEPGSTQASQERHSEERHSEGQRSKSSKWRLALWLAASAPLVLTAAWNLAVLLRVFFGRFDHPMDLEWMEGGQLYHAQRVLEGRTLFGECPDGFIPFPYPPIHTWLLAAVGAVFGLDYAPARLLSIVAFTLACLVLCREVVIVSRPHPRTGLLVLVTASAIAASYPITGAFYDVVRVDSVFAALLFGGAALVLPTARQPLRSPLHSGRIAAAAITLVAALYAKQTAVFFLPWICAYALWRERKSGLRLTVAIAVLAAGLLALLQWRSGGYFWTYVFEVMSHHPTYWFRASGHALVSLVFAPYLLLLPILYGWLHRRGRVMSRSSYWLGMLLCALVASILTSSKIGAVSNNIITLLMLAPAAAMMLCAQAHRAMARRWPRDLSALVFLLLSSVWFHYRTIEPLHHIPNARMRAAAEVLNREIAALPGDVLFPSHPFIPVRNGHRGKQIHEQGYIDVVGADIETIDVTSCITQLDADWLVLDDMSQPYLVALLLPAYEPHRRLPPVARALIGMYTRPDSIYRRKAEVPAWRPRRDRRTLFDFESGTYAGWERLDDAFAAGPSVGRPPFMQPIVGHRGRYLVNSFHPRLGDTATGTLRSPPFLIDRHQLGLRLGGGRSQNLRVELQVDGEVVRRVAGVGQDFEALTLVVWDVSELRGRSARLVIVDAERGGWGHLLFDEAELFELAPH